MLVNIKEVAKKRPDFIIQLGDFCRPYDYNNKFFSIWNIFPRDKHNVIVNHEMDRGLSREQVIQYLNSPAKFYSFNKKRYHFIILDGNDINPSPERTSGYPRYIGIEQKNWLKNDLKSINLPVIVFSHQSLDSEGIENRKEIMSILEKENHSAEYRKVIVSFSRHHHTDYSTNINGIYYF
jgi:hypothetical protein